MEVPKPDSSSPSERPLDRLARRIRDLSLDDDDVGNEVPEAEPYVGSLALVPPALLRLRDYTVVRCLGRGGMGAVYLAHPRALPDKQVALKVLPDLYATDPERLARFRNEATTASRLSHPGVVAVLDIAHENGVHFQVQELVEDGRTLGDLVREVREAATLPKDWYRHIAGLFAKIADALAAVHAANVLHRDIKPSNILLTPAGEPKVADFGLAKDLEGISGLTRSVSPGTLNYKSPEQIDRSFGKVGERTDVFSLGVTLYEALTLTRLFPGDDTAEVNPAILHREIVDLREVRAGVPKDLSTICRKCLEKRHGARYASMVEVAADLRRFLDNEPILAKDPGPLVRLGKWCKRHPALAASSVLVLLGVWIFATERGARSASESFRLWESAQRAAVEGRWAAAAGLAVDARAHGYQPAGEVDLARIEMLIAADDAEGATAAVELARAAPELRTSHRLQQLSLDVDLDTPTNRMERARVLHAEATSAKSTDLRPSDLSYLQAIGSDEPQTALAAVRQALLLEPRHVLANRLLLPLLLFLGEHAEIPEDVARQAVIFPDDSKPRFCAALALALGGRVTDAEEQVRLLGTEAEREVVNLALQLIPKVEKRLIQSTDVILEVPGAKEDAVGTMAMVAQVLGVASKIGRSKAMSALRLVPCIELRFNAKLLSAANPPEDPLVALVRITRTKMDMSSLLATEALAMRSIGRGLLGNNPVAHRALLVCILKIQGHMWMQRQLDHDQTALLRARIIDVAGRLVDAQDTDVAHLRMALDYMAEIGDVATAKRMVARLEGRSADTGWFDFLRVKVLLMERDKVGNVDLAIRLLQRVVRDFPEHAEAGALLKTLEAQANK